MKHTARIVSLSALTCIAAQAAPFLAVGDNAELFVTASASVKFDDNIYLDPTGTINNVNYSKTDDVIYSFTPGVDFVFGKGAVTTGNVYFQEEIRRYADASNQDDELADVGANVAYNNGLTKANLNASYKELAQNDNDLNALGTIVRRDVTSLGGGLEFGVSEKTALAVGSSFVKTDYAPAGYSDSDVWTIPLNVYYKASPKLDWSLGYQYRTSDLSGAGIDSDDNFFNIGARGEFSPKLKGQLRVGYTQRSFDNGGDANLFGLDSGLTYLVSEKSSLQLNVNNDFGSSAFGSSTKDFTIGLTSSNKFTEQWAVDVGVNYRKQKYLSNGRKDDFIEGRLGATYVLSSLLNFQASYTYRDNDSSSALATFKNNVFSLGANLRY